MELEEVLTRLAKGPAVLFLGQHYLATDTGSDPLLAEFLKKYKPTTTNNNSYTQLLDGFDATQGEATLSWIDERCKRIAPPEWLKIVSDYPWNAVFTSAIDSVWPGCFRNSWRDVNLILEEKYNPSNPRNQLLLHCTCLFGCVNKADDSERPPLNSFELLKRKYIANVLAHRIPDTLTPWGTLLIEGYSEETDWFSLNELSLIIDSLNPGQAHVFSADEQLVKTPIIARLVAQNKICIHRESLAKLLSLGQDKGMITLGAAPQNIGSNHRLLVKNKAVSIPKEIWNQTSKSATILTTDALELPPPLSEDARYREFRSFLSGQEGKPRWASYARGFSFKREFESTLMQEVVSRLNSRDLRLRDEPIILHGQTGVGKSVALGSLAFEIAKTQEYAVLYIEHRTQRPAWQDLDKFGKWIEDIGASACLIVWDGMLEPREYSGLLRTLTGRMRKVVLVGSSYKREESLKYDKKYISVAAVLSATEKSRFQKFLASFHPSFAKLMDLHLDETFLVALYRLLPPTRGLIRSGLMSELAQAEKILTDNAAKSLNREGAATVLAQALMTAGLISQAKSLEARTVEVAGEEMPEIHKLTGLIMVPGQFGLNVPFELLLRAMGKGGYAQLPELFRGLDIFSWQNDQVGNIEIGPRNSLEARIVVQSRLGGAKAEIEFACELLAEVKDDESHSSGTEINFAVELIHAMGARGAASDYFAPYFVDIAKTLKRLRKERGVKNSRLMLQEANLWRQWTMEQDGTSDAECSERGVILKAAESILQEAIELGGGNSRQRDFHSHLLVELATNKGFQAMQALRDKTNSSESVTLYKDARQLLTDARRLDPENYYPTDIIAWLTLNLIKGGHLSDEDRVEAIADVLNAFQLTEGEELTPEQRDRFQKRRLEFGDMIGDADLADDAFKRLADQGSGAGYYWRAINMSGLREMDNVLDSKSQKKLAEGLGYLESNLDKIKSDVRCLELYLDLWWMVNTRTQLFAKERVALPLSRAAWEDCLKIIERIEMIGKSSRHSRILFLHGLACFHLGAVAQALVLFEEIKQETEQLKGRWRNTRSYVVSDPDGKPVRYHGNVAWVNDHGSQGEIAVDELRQKIRFLPTDFGRPDIRKGETLGDFHIAFNFRGVIADPIDFRRGTVG